MTALINELAVHSEADEALLVPDDYHVIGPPLVHESPGFSSGPSLVRASAWLVPVGACIAYAAGGPMGVDDMEVARINRKG